MEILIDVAIIGIWASLILICLATLGIVAAGVRSIGYGKVERLSIAIVLVPVVLFVLLGLIFSANAELTVVQAWSHAGVWTALIMFVAVACGLAYTGVRSAIA